MFVVLSSNKDGDVLSFLFESFAIGIVITSVITFILAYISIFSVLLFSGAIVIIDIGLLIVIFCKRLIKKIHLDRIDKTSSFFFLILLLYIVFNLLFVTDWTSGWRDYSCYYYQTIHIAEKGTIFYENDDDYLEDNYIEIDKISSLTYAGLYYDGKDDLSGEHTFSYQFYHLFSSFLVLAYILGGKAWILYGTPVIAGVGIFYLFSLFKKIASSRVALLAILIYMINPATIWNSRITVSEVLCQLLILMACFYYSISNEKKFFGGFSSAILLSLIHICKMDMYIVMFAVVCYGIYRIIFFENGIKFRSFLSTYLLFSIGYTPFLYYSNKNYLIEHWEMGVLDKITYLCVLSILCLLLTALFRNLIRTVIKKINIQKSVGIAVIDFIAFLTFLLVRIGNNYQIPFFSNLSILTWYISPFLLFFVPYGLYSILKEKNKDELSLLLLIGIVNGVIYIYKPSIASDHMWMSRRWFTIIIPIAILFGIKGLERTKVFFIKSLIIVCTIVFSLWGSRTFIVKPIMKGCMDCFDELSDKMDDNLAYFAREKTAITILKTVYNKHAYILDNYSNIENYLQDNDYLLYIGSTEDINQISENISCQVKIEKEDGVYRILDDLERSKDHLPSEIIEYPFDMNIYKISIDKKPIDL